MRLLRNKSFKTLIITKRSIIITVCFVVLFIVGLVLILKKDKFNSDNQYTSADDFHNVILSSQLHNESDNSHIIEKAIEIILGFNPQKPETILSNFSEDVKINYEYNASEVVYPEPSKEPAPTPTSKTDENSEKPIEEVSQAKGMSISNATNIKINTNELISQELAYSLDGDGPQVLIVHTHTTESYTDSGKTKYTTEDSDRSTDETKNITAVGEVLRQTLEERGISVIHDTTVHDYPSYNGAYNRSKATVVKNLEKYPSIKLVLDVHRDGIVKSDGTKVKVAADINSEKAAQCMFVVGSNVSLTHDSWLENMKLAVKLQNKANELYPNLMRPINLREERFNQQLSKGAIIIEVGSNGNTLNEAKAGVKLMGNVIAELFEK